MNKRQLRHFLLACTALFFCVVPAYAANLQSEVTVITVPNVPTNLSGSASSQSEIDLSWTNNASDATGFSIERSTGNDSDFSQIATVGPGVTVYSDTGLTADTTYFYRVSAFVDASYSPYSGETSVTTPSTPVPPSSGGGSGGGGGGGGGYYEPSTTNTSVTIAGAAYPGSEVTILENGQIVVETTAGPNGMFTANVTGLAGGNYNFSIYGEDSSGNRSSLFTFPASVTPGATTEIGGVFISPTIGVDKSEVKQGDTLAIFGKSVPNADVSIQVHSDQAIFANVTSTSSGAYLYDLDTAPLAIGAHTAKSKASANNLISDDSVVQAFTVGNENIAAVPASKCPAKGDLNGDCKVNLVDFSILAYWYKRANPPVAYLLDGQSTVDFTDFSIMAFYWTG